MKKLVLAFTLAVAAALPASAQTVIFSENIGTGATGNPAANTYTGYQNFGTLTYAGTAGADIRTTNPSNEAGSRYAGSGGNNVFFSQAGSASFTISSINTTGYEANEFTLSYGIRKQANANDGSGFLVEYSTTGSSWISLGSPSLATGSGSTGWYLVTLADITLPTSTTLFLRFSDSSASYDYRLDDITLSGVAAVPEPSTYAMVFAGLGVMVWTLRRKRA